MNTMNSRRNYNYRIGHKQGNLLLRSLFYVLLLVLYILP